MALDLDEAVRKHQAAGKLLDTLLRKSGRSILRERDAERKRRERADERVVLIPRCVDRDRRLELEDDDVKWLMHYYGVDSGCPDPFWYEFTNQQREMIEGFTNVIKFGGDQSVAASRGEGKTTILERIVSKYTLQGVLNYSVLFQASGALAENSLESIKSAFAENDNLHEDYPEVCACVRAIGTTPQRANSQLIKGFRFDDGEPFGVCPSRFKWSGNEVKFPQVPGSPSTGAIIATRGLDAAVRGLKKDGKRPQLAAIDDADTEETSRSAEQAKKLENRIDRSIGGLGGQQRPISRIMLCTIQSRTACAYKFTDPAQKPTWKGKRFRYLIKAPDRTDLWEEYLQILRDELQAFASGASTDKHHRISHQFYLDRRAEMDAGAEVANENRYNSNPLPDGTLVEESALQHYYNRVAAIGADAVATEYDNDPPDELDATESGISANKIQQRLSGYERGVIPPDCTTLTQGIDVQKAGLHWVVKAWRADATNYVIDYGFHESHGTVYGSDEGVELAVRRAVLERMEAARQRRYATTSGEPFEIGLTLVDSGWEAPSIYQACLEIGLGIYPAKGHGRSHGCASPSFREALNATKDRQPGDGWFMQRQPSGVWLVHCDTDRWKSFEHARWLTPDGRAGAAYLFGDITDEERLYLEKRSPRDAKQHFGFVRHLTAEIEVEEVVRGSLRRAWKVKAGRVQNHYFDAAYLADVAASMLDIRILPSIVVPEEPKKSAVISAGVANQSRW